MATSPTARALDHCRKHSMQAAIVERWIPQTNRRKDVFGFGDILALDGLPGSLLIQVTSTSGMSARVKKISDECRVEALAWVEAGNRIEVWGFAKRVHRNKDGTKSKLKRWALRVVPIDRDGLV